MENRYDLAMRLIGGGYLGLRSDCRLTRIGETRTGLPRLGASNDGGLRAVTSGARSAVVDIRDKIYHYKAIDPLNVLWPIVKRRDWIVAPQDSPVERDVPGTLKSQGDAILERKRTGKIADTYAQIGMQPARQPITIYRNLEGWSVISKIPTRASDLRLLEYDVLLAVALRGKDLDGLFSCLDDLLKVYEWFSYTQGFDSQVHYKSGISIDSSLHANFSRNAVIAPEGIRWVDYEDCSQDKIPNSNWLAHKVLAKPLTSILILKDLQAQGKQIDLSGWPFYSMRWHRLLSGFGEAQARLDTDYDLWTCASHTNNNFSGESRALLKGLRYSFDAGQRDAKEKLAEVSVK